MSTSIILVVVYTNQFTVKHPSSRLARSDRRMSLTMNPPLDISATDVATRVTGFNYVLPTMTLSLTIAPE